MDGRFLFFQEYLKHPLQIASFIPSSRFLERRILEAAGISSVKTIVELGYVSTYIREIVTHAGVTKPVLCLYMDLVDPESSDLERPERLLRLAFQGLAEKRRKL